MQTGVYRHYKGMEYRVLCVAKLEETLEEAVVYQALYGDYTVWIRPLSVFQEGISIPEFEYTGPRFQYVRPWTPKEAKKHPHALAFLPS